MDPITEPIPNEQNDNNNEEEQIEQHTGGIVGGAVPQIKKKELSQKQIDHLNAIRGKALERKREIKLQKHEEYKKQAMEKKVQQIEIKQEPMKQEPKQEPIKQEEAKPKIKY